MSERTGSFPVRKLLSVALAVVVAGSLAIGSAHPHVSLAAPQAVQNSPQGSCLPGATPGARIDGIIAVLIGVTAPPAVPDAAASSGRCLGAVALGFWEPLGFGSWLGMDKEEIWSRYEEGESLTRIATGAGKDRDAVIAQLQSMYASALDEAIGAGAIDGSQRERIADRILPHFSWLVDWIMDNGVAVAAGDVNGDGIVDLFTLKPGENGSQLMDDVIDVVLATDADGDMDVDASDFLIWSRMFESGASGDLWPVIGPEIFGNLAERIAGEQASTPAELLEMYRSGNSVREIAEINGHDGDELAADLRARAKAELDAAVNAGTIPAADRERAAAELLFVIIVVLDHHTGDPLPSDFTNTTLDDEAAA